MSASPSERKRASNRKSQQLARDRNRERLTRLEEEIIMLKDRELQWCRSNGSLETDVKVLKEQVSTLLAALWPPIQGGPGVWQGCWGGEQCPPVCICVLCNSITTEWAVTNDPSILNTGSNTGYLEGSAPAQMPMTGPC